MPRKKKQKDYGFREFEKIHGSGNNHHARITDDMRQTKAWKALSIHARYLYQEFKFKYNGKNENDLSFTYKEALELMTARSFTKCIDELIECGFIKLIQQNWTTRKPNIYGLSDQWKFYGTKQMDVKPRVKRKVKQKEPVESVPDNVYQFVAAAKEKARL